ncbi:ESCRT-I complex subunit VPS37 [Clonorchis sinensis]|uniref:ESCRT-I complex subunit VPS37 n=1 Tax=Clonorchis sinensis TaxID=79923 RepID=G7YTY4_CLOSI|nr:ESCRT-I complex subunit VPS37 [Clonorchis sinensis]
MEENKKLAEANQSLETSFLLQRTELGNAYSEVLKAKSRYQELRSKIDAVKAKYAPDTIWALMMTKKCETEEQSKVGASTFYLTPPPAFRI